MEPLKVRRVRQIKKQISIDAFCRLTPETRLGLKLFPDEPEKLEDLEKAIQAFPTLDITCKAEVKGEKEIAVGDLLTIEIKLSTVNQVEG